MHPKDIVYEDGKAAQLAVIAEHLQSIKIILYFVLFFLVVAALK